MSEEPRGSQSWATPEFYESNARADDIRSACVPILQKLHRLFYDPAIIEDFTERSRILSEIELDNGALIELGVELRMEEGRALVEYQSNPLVAAQYLAGQLLRLIETDTDSSASTKQIGEGVEELGDDVMIINSLDFSPQARDFAVKQQMFLFIKDGFAIDDSTLTSLNDN